MRLTLRACLTVSTLALIGAGALAMGGGNGKKDSMLCLVRPDDPPDANATGTLRIRHKGNGDSFEVHVMQVTAGNVHHLFLEDPLGSDTFTDVGALVGDGGSQQFKVDTKQGGTLPLAAASLDDLIGRRVEIRHDLDVVLEGEVPPWDLSKHPMKAKVAIDAPDGAPSPDMHGTLSLRAKDDKGQERIDLKTQKVPWGDGPFEVFVEDGVASGVFVDAGALDKLDEHNGRFRRDTKHGQALPAGAFFCSELAGRLIEVRRQSNDVVYLRGTIPMVE